MCPLNYDAFSLHGTPTVNVVGRLPPLQVFLSAHSLDSVDVPPLMINISEGANYGEVARKIMEALPPQHGEGEEKEEKEENEEKEYWYEEELYVKVGYYILIFVWIVVFHAHRLHFDLLKGCREHI